MVVRRFSSLLIRPSPRPQFWNIFHNSGGFALFLSVALSLTGCSLESLTSLGSPTGSSSLTSEGSGIADPSLKFGHGTSYDFGTHGVGSTASVRLLVTYSGNAGATDFAVLTAPTGPFGFTGGSFPGTGGTCGSAISASCSIALSFTPTTPGVSSATLEFSYASGSAIKTLRTRLVGNAGVPAVLTISDGATYNFGTRAIGSITEKTFTITYSGTMAAASVTAATLTAPYAFKGGNYPGTGGTCATSISSSCTVVLTYSPGGAGNTTAILSLAYNDGSANKSAERSLEGTGATPAVLSISDGAIYSFGSQAVGSMTSEKVFTVSYSGSLPATAVSGSGLAAPYSFKGGSYPGTGGTCADTISADCTLVVSFSPVAAGTFTDQLILSYHDGAATQSSTRDLTGSAVTPAVLTISDGITYDFGAQATSSTSEKTFTVTHSGGSAATTIAASGLSAPYDFKGGVYPGTGGSCGTSLSSGSCTIVITFQPVATVTSPDTLLIDYNDGTSMQQATRDITGTGVAPGTLTISDGATFGFGTRATGSSTDKTFTISRAGGVPATSVIGSGLSAPFFFKGGSYPGAGGTCGTTINTSCTIVVNYAPTADGLENSTIQIDYHNGTSNVQATRPVSGTGAAPASLTLSDGPSYSFGQKVVSTVTEKIFTVSHVGGVAATGVTSSALAAPLAYKGGTYPGTGGTCGTSISASCTIVVTFSPTTTGTYSSNLVLSYHNGVSAQTENRPITGEGVNTATLTISDGPTYDFGITAPSYTASKTFTITNTGSAAATALAETGLNSPFAFRGGTYPGAGGTCTNTLAASGTCTLVIDFTPLSEAVFNDTIELSYFNVSTTVVATRNITGNGSPIRQIVAGKAHTCALYYAGSIKCWGLNTDGQLGTGTTSSGSSSPVWVTGITDALQIAAGDYHTCAVINTSTASIKCWGANLSGQMGVGTTSTSQPMPTTVSGLTGLSMTAVSAGASHTCATTSTKTLRCWGSDLRGQMNQAGTSNRTAPVTTISTSTVNGVTSGADHICVVTTGAQIQCWGANTYGQVGNNSTTDRTSPTTLSLNNVAEVSGGENHTCARMIDKTLRCWGRDTYGQIGENAASSNLVPEAVTGITTATAIATGANHSCAILSDGSMNCWGDDQNGQLGDDSTLAQQTTAVPVVLPGVSSAVQLTAGGDHTCAVLDSKKMVCWGQNSSGELGDSTTTRRPLPQEVVGL